ncbi:MAG: peptidoglycan DD-metalloendopeptidase family protein [Candidatus Woesearchaeota archaeon]|nr:peptidoglycan DD-metalloendopeptidase family protein [Candidatus Woesearchaeota archaeon]
MVTRKGETFMFGLNIIFLLAIFVLFWKLGLAYQQHNSGEDLGVRQMAVLHTYTVSERMLLYIDTAARYAAYEAFNTLMEDSAINPVDSECGTYAGYYAWTALDTKCFPATIQDTYTKQLTGHLRDLVLYPGIDIPTYSFALTVEGAALNIAATTEDTITLPIVAVKDANQRLADQVVLANDIPTVQKGYFTPDVEAQVLPSPNKVPRTTPVEGIVLLNVSDASTAIAQYTEGTQQSLHYLVNSDGIYQFVPEAQEALCNCEQQATHISIGVVAGTPKDALKEVLPTILMNNGLQPQDVDPGDVFDEQFINDVVAWKSEAELAPEEAVEEVQLDVSWPTDSRSVTSCYGVRDYIKGNDKFHDGIDMGGKGDTIYAFADGIVIDPCDGRKCGAGYGKTIMIKHAEDRYTRYSHMEQKYVAIGDVVQRGQPIGTVGNTGFTSGKTGYHLDFKVYISNDFGGDKAKNPFCFFDDTTLSSLSFTGKNCRESGFKNHQLTKAHPDVAADCAGITAHRVTPLCELNTFDVQLGGDKLRTATVNNLKEESAKLGVDLFKLIEEVGAEEGVDHRLIFAFIAQESRGRANAVSHSGCAGLGQFCGPTAGDYPEFFPTIKRCRCGEKECTDVTANCVGDSRFDAQASIRAIPKLLKAKMSHFPGKKDKMRFGIAAYNGGQATIKAAIERTGISDPTWEDVSAALDERIIERFFCKETNPEGYFCYRGNQTQKVHEIRNYVPGVMSLFVAEGGSSVSAFSDQVCGEARLSVKELGRYTFKPSFTTTVPNLLTEVERVIAWAEETHNECDGSAGKNNIDCLAAQKETINTVSCRLHEDDRGIVTQFKQATRDCADNLQVDCYCTFNPRQATDYDLSMRLYGDDLHVLVNGEGEREPYGAPEVRFQASGEPITTETIELFDEKGKRSLRVWTGDDAGEEHEGEPYKTIKETYPVEDFLFVKDADGVYWTSATKETLKDADIQQCGFYKTTHHICIASEQATYLLSAGTTVTPVIKFALHLEDTHNPAPVTDLQAVKPLADSLIDTLAVNTIGISVSEYLATDVDISFTGSTSKDVSYYIIECGKNTQIVHADAEEYDLKKVACEPKTLAALRTAMVTPVDISGNVGIAEAVPIEEATDVL